MRRLVAGLMMLSLFLLVAPRATAFSGSFSDPDDTTSKLDLKTLSHSDTASTVTYRADLYDVWKPSDTPYYAFVWLLDADNNGVFDNGCVVISDSAGGPGTMQFSVEKGSCLTSSTTTLQTGTASQPTTSSIEVTVDRTKLQQMGLGGTGSSYRYIVKTFDAGSASERDTAPNTGSYTHTLDAVPATTTTTATTLPSQSVATATPNTLAAGEKTTLTGEGFAANTPLTVIMFSDPLLLAQANADAAGRYSITVTIPTATVPGTHRIVVSGKTAAGGSHESSTTITVTLPRTGGAHTGHTAGLAVATIALGFALLALAYYERRLVSVGATRAAAAFNHAFRRFDI